MANDLWETPPEVYFWLKQRFNFVLDAAASELNNKCPAYLTEEQNALTINWHDITSPNGWVWLNCPYSDPLVWVDKAIETMKQGTGVVMLLNCDQSVRWFARAHKHISEVIHFIANDEERPGYHGGRIAFIDTETKLPMKSNNKPQFVLVFNPQKYTDIVTSYHCLKDVMAQGLIVKNNEAA